MSRLMVLKDLVAFLLHRKKWWLLPIFLILFLMSGLILWIEGSAVLPFIYALF